VPPTDYNPWPRDGCTLAEARERTADRGAWNEWRDLVTSFAGEKHQESGKRSDHHSASQGTVDHTFHISELERRINTDFHIQITARQLIAYGRLGHPSAAPRVIGASLWPTLTRVDWEHSTVSEDRGGSAIYFAVRMFPVLLAPCRADLIADCSLSDAFKRFVLGDPEVVPLAANAVKRAPEFERVFVRGRCYVQGVDEWPMNFEHRILIGYQHHDPSKRSIFCGRRDPDPIEVAFAAEALIDRFGVLIGMLRQGQLKAQALPVNPGDPDTIFPSIWAHDDFCFNAMGDVFEDNKECEDPRWDRLKRRWIGVMLRAPFPLSVPIEAPSGDSGLHAVNLQPDDQSPVYPDLVPFTVADVLQEGSLSRALTRLVFKHPEVISLRRAANDATSAAQSPPLEEDAGLVGLVTGHDEPLLPLRYFPRDDYDPETSDVLSATPEAQGIGDEFFGPAPPAVEAFYDAINLRARTLIEMLQDQKLAARGHTADGHLVPIAHTIWRHEDYYVHPPTGDVYEAAPRSMKKRWTGVVLEASGRPREAELFHVKPTTPDVLLPATPEPQQLASQPSKSIARVETSSASRKACVAWLTGIMRASPDVRTLSRAELWEKAQEKWPLTLSLRSFLVAREEAIRQTGANVWAAGGAPRKSQRANRRAD
jgi:hypothetical protein